MKKGEVERKKGKVERKKGEIEKGKGKVLLWEVNTYPEYLKTNVLKINQSNLFFGDFESKSSIDHSSKIRGPRIRCIKVL